MLNDPPQPYRQNWLCVRTFKLLMTYRHNWLCVRTFKLLMTSLSTHRVYTPQHLPANRSDTPHPLLYVSHPLFYVLQNCISLTCLQTGVIFHTPYSMFHTPYFTFYKIVLVLLACKQEWHSTPLVLHFTKTVSLLLLENTCYCFYCYKSISIHINNNENASMSNYPPVCHSVDEIWTARWFFVSACRTLSEGSAACQTIGRDLEQVSN